MRLTLISRIAKQRADCKEYKKSTINHTICTILFVSMSFTIIHYPGCGVVWCVIFDTHVLSRNCIRVFFFLLLAFSFETKPERSK